MNIQKNDVFVCFDNIPGSEFEPGDILQVVGTGTEQSFFKLKISENFSHTYILKSVNIDDHQIRKVTNSDSVFEVFLLAKAIQAISKYREELLEKRNHFQVFSMITVLEYVLTILCKLDKKPIVLPKNVHRYYDKNGLLFELVGEGLPESGTLDKEKCEFKQYPMLPRGSLPHQEIKVVIDGVSYDKISKITLIKE